MLAHDFRMALRSIRARARTSTMTVVTLAVGMGAATSMFSLVNTVLLRPLAFPDADRLVKVIGHHQIEGGRSNLSPADFYDFSEEADSFESMGAHGWVGLVTVSGGDGPAIRIGAVSVTAGFFETLGVEPQLGRWFLEDEDVSGAPRTAMLTHGLWQSRFGGADGVLGSDVLVNSRPHRIVGVLPRGFRHPEPNPERDPQLYTLYRFPGDELSRSGRFIRAIGRLSDDHDVAAAQSELETITARLAAEYPESNFGRSARVIPLKESIVGSSRRSLVVLLGAVGLLLLIACVNLANLQLGQLGRRQQELGMQMALGASFPRLLRQLSIESGLLSVIGGASALTATYFSIPALSLRVVPRAGELRLDATVFSFAFILCALTTVAFGLLPALRLRAMKLEQSVAIGASTRLTRRNATRRLLIGAQVALAFVLLVGAGLFIKSLWRLTSVSPGFTTEALVTMQLAVPLAEYPEGDQIPFYERLYDALESQPTVDSVGAVNILPLTLNYSSDGFQINDHPLPEGQKPSAEARSVNVRYFEAMKIPLVRGRLFTEGDRADTPGVIIVSQSMADKFWPDEEVLGKQITYNRGVEGDRQDVGGAGTREIVGVVGDVSHLDLSGGPVPMFYTPQTQPPSFHSMHLIVRTRTDASTVVGTVREAVSSIDSNVPLYGIRTLEQVVAGSTQLERIRVALLSGFAAVSLALALVGIYAVMTLAINQRTREFGIRMALGADRHRVWRMLMRDNLTPLVGGIILGLALAFGMSGTLRGLLFGIESTDPLVYAVLSMLVFLLGVLTVALPARRLGELDPAHVLRDE